MLLAARGGQEYAFVTFDLAVAKMVYALVLQYTEKFNNDFVRMNVFHTICSLFGTLGKMMKDSGIAEKIIESDNCASGSLDRVMSGKHFNRALRVQKLVKALVGAIRIRSPTQCMSF